MRETLFEQHPSVMLVIDPDDTTIVDANLAAVRFYGWSREQLRSMRIGDINTLDDERIAQEVDAARTAQRDYFEFVHRTAGGELRHVEVYSGRVRLDDRELLYSVVHDATERVQAAARLQASEEFASTIIAHAPLGIAVADLDGRLVRVNQALCAITGYDQDQLLGRDYRSMTHPDDRAATDTSSRRLLAGEVDAYHLAKRYLRADGASAYVETSSTLLRDAHGTPRFQLGIVHDVTERHRAAERAELAAQRARDAAAQTDRLAARLTDTMRSVTDGILLLDHDLVATYVNPRFEALLGVASEHVVGRQPAQVLPATIGADCLDAFHRAVTHQTTQQVVVRHDPLGRFYEVHVYPSSQGLAVYLRDVTDRIEREAALERAAETERADADRLRQLDEAKNAFLSAVSHELRTPLTVVQGMAETLVEHGGRLDDALRARLERSLADKARELAVLLDDLLHVDRLSRGTLQAQRNELDLADLVRRVTADSSVADRVRVDAPPSLLVLADPVQVEHLLTNLLSNVAKYAPDGCVEVDVRPGATGGFRIEVADRGPGIPPAMLERVFDAFTRVDDDHPSPGTGVGLALVAEFARLHGGRAWAEDTGGAGARIVVDIPDAGAAVITDTGA